jgi:hypothetical protein
MNAGGSHFDKLNQVVLSMGTVEIDGRIVTQMTPVVHGSEFLIPHAKPQKTAIVKRMAERSEKNEKKEAASQQRHETSLFSPFFVSFGYLTSSTEIREKEKMSMSTRTLRISE